MMRKEAVVVTIGIEDSGNYRNTFKEDVEQVDELKMPKKDASGRIKSIRFVLRYERVQKSLQKDEARHLCSC